MWSFFLFARKESLGGALCTARPIVWGMYHQRQNMNSGYACCDSLRASPPTLSMWPCWKISHIQVLSSNFFPTPPIKLKLGLQVNGRLLIATHLDQSNYLANQKQGPVNTYNLTVSIRLFLGSSRALKVLRCFTTSTVLNSWTSLKLSSAGSHTESWWRVL
jgi:hypothetical protein